MASDKFVQPFSAIQFVRHEWTADELATFRRRVANGEDAVRVATDMAIVEVARQQAFERQEEDR
jgi:hypothetical protein